jgi:hypothetical protein
LVLGGSQIRPSENPPRSAGSPSRLPGQAAKASAVAAASPPSRQRAQPAARTALTASTTTAGTIHTQWWSQLTGDTSRPVSAQASTPISG